MTDYRNELPIAWEVSAIRDKRYVDGLKLQPECKRFTTETEANTYKTQMQSEGWIASTRPIFVGKKTRGEKLRKRQLATFGQFNQDWKLTR